MGKEEMEEHLKRAGVDEYVAKKIRSIASNTCGRVIYLDGNDIGDNGAKAVAEALKTNTTLENIILGLNNIGPEGAKAVAGALKTNTTLTEIHLRLNNIGDNGAKAVAEALKTNTTLRVIGLGLNNIGPEGAKAIAEALKTNTTLTEIHLWENNIGPEGAKALAEALKTNTTLETIFLQNNDLNSISCAEAIAAAEVFNPKVSIRYDKFTAAALKAYQATKKIRNTLQLLQTGSVPLSTAKVFVCGHYGIGKTTLIGNIRRSFGQALAGVFRSGKPEDTPDNPQERTAGIEQRHLSISQPSTSSSATYARKGPASLRIFDFAGQLDYHVVHELLFADLNAAFVVCVDLSQPRQSVEDSLLYWLRFICTRLTQAARATASGDGTKPRVIIVGTKADKAHTDNTPQQRGPNGLIVPWMRAFLERRCRAFQAVIHINMARTPNAASDESDDSRFDVVALNSHSPSSTEFERLRGLLYDHWQHIIQQEIMVPKVVDVVSKGLDKCRRENQGLWLVHELYQWLQENGHSVTQHESFSERIFHLTLRYLHARGDVLWFADSPTLADRVFVSPEWLLKTVVGPALAPDHFVIAKLQPERGVVTWDDFCDTYTRRVDPDLAIHILQRMLLCFELPAAVSDGASNTGTQQQQQQQRQFMLPSQLREKINLSEAWKKQDSVTVYAGRRFIVDQPVLADDSTQAPTQEHVFMFPPGFFPRVQTRMSELFKESLKLWQDALWGNRESVHCVCIMRDTAIDIWVQGFSSKEADVLATLNQVLATIREEMEGVPCTHLVLSTKHLEGHNPYPAGYELDHVSSKAPSDIVTSTHPPGEVDEPRHRLLLAVPAGLAGSDWHADDLYWWHDDWALNKEFDKSLIWAPSSRVAGVCTARLPSESSLFQWIAPQIRSSAQLSRVIVTKSSSKIRGFQSCLRSFLLQRNTPNSPFDKDFGATDNEKFTMLEQMKTHMAQTNPRRHVNVMLLWHGCGEDVADDIVAAGAASICTTDPGYFGKGIYLTPQAHYALEYARTKQANAAHEYVILLCAVAIGLAYPVTRGADYKPGAALSNYFGGPLKGSCDAHYTQVVKRPINGVENQTTDCPGTFDYEEVAVHERAQVLPIAKVYVK